MQYKLSGASLADCFEHSTEQASQLKNEVGDSAFGTGFRQVPGGEEFRNRSILSW